MLKKFVNFRIDNSYKYGIMKVVNHQESTSNHRMWELLRLNVL